MLCRHCGCDIPDRELARHLAAKGGAKGRRELDSETARAMQVRSVEARRRNEAKREQESPR